MAKGSAWCTWWSCWTRRTERQPRRPVLHKAASGDAGIVAAQAFQFAAKAGAVQGIEQRRDGREIQVLAADRQVVACAGQRDEVQSEDTGHGARGDTAIRIARAHLPGSLEMAASQAIITMHISAGNTQTIEMRIEQEAAARAGFAINDADIAPREVRDGVDRLGIAGGQHKAFLPNGQRDDRHAVPPE